jgi:ABC-type transport system involved in multi-copper enzyme maturation permease subunit
MAFTSGVTALAGFLPAFSGLEVLGDPLRTAEVARGIFQYLVITEVALVTFIVPGITSEAIGLEREQKTLDLLLTTALKPSEILFGKLLGAAGYMMLLISPSLPLFALCGVFHGATVTQVVMVYALMVIAALVWGGLGVTLSATAGDLAAAKYATYGCVFATAILPGSPLWLAFYVANPNGLLMGLPLTAVGLCSCLWLGVGAPVLVAQWASACFQLGPRYDTSYRYD